MPVYLDTETTGLHGGADEIVEIAIINDDGQVLINSLVKPIHNKTWKDAQQIHGISPDDVVNAPTLVDLMPSILKAIKNQTVVIYNANFDVCFFSSDTFEFSKVECCMLDFAEELGEWNDYRQSYRWHKLIDAAGHVDHEWSGDAHRALADTQATRSVWQWLQEQVKAAAARKAAKVKNEPALKRQREKRHQTIEQKAKVFAKNLRKRGATPDVFIQAGTPERLTVVTRSEIFKAGRETEKWIVAGFGYTPGSRNNRKEFLLYKPFKLPKKAEPEPKPE